MAADLFGDDTEQRIAALEARTGSCHSCGATIAHDLHTCTSCARDYDAEQQEDLDRRIPWPGRES
jgi:hypothetical protein